MSNNERDFLEEHDKKVKEDLLEEILEILSFHSEEIEVVYGDGTKGKEKYVPLQEVKYAISVIKGEDDD